MSSTGRFLMQVARDQLGPKNSPVLLETDLGLRAALTVIIGRKDYNKPSQMSATLP